MRAMSLFGLFDGHGGRDVVDFVSASFPRNLATIMAREQKPQLTVQQQVSAAYLLTDAQSAQRGHMSSGSTAVTALLIRDPVTGVTTLHTANVGDSRAVLCENGRAIRLTRDHKADDPREVARIEDAGGFVLRRRVLGILAVSRSFGDHTMKKFVVAQPETDARPLKPPPNGCHPFLILACDGVWDVMSDDDAVRLVAECVRKLGAERGEAEAASKLVHESIRRGSCDNVTAIVVFF